jgi:trigger factor
LTVEIIEVNSCKRNLAVEIPAVEVDQEIAAIAGEYARNIKVPGFRPGKVPLNIIKQRFAGDLMKDATQKIIERCWKNALTDHNLKPLAEPTIKDLENKPGSPLKFTVSFEILPPLEVKEYKGVNTVLPKSDISEDEVNQAIESLRERQAQFIPAEGEEAQDGYYLTLTMDYRFEETGKPIHEDDIPLIMGHPKIDVELSNNLRGVKTGETRNFEISYPEDFYRKKFAGKKIWYSVTIKDIKEKQVPELNDEFAKDIGSESIDGLRTKVRDDLVTQAKQNAEKKARETMLDTIVQSQSIDVPECMIQDELEAHAHRIASNLAYQGIDINQTSLDWKKIFEEERPHAEQAVRRTIFLDAIARQEGIEVSKEEVDSELQKIAEGTSKSAVALRAQLEKEDRIQSFEKHLRQNKALDFIYRNANITEG